MKALYVRALDSEISVVDLRSRAADRSRANYVVQALVAHRAGGEDGYVHRYPDAIKGDEAKIMFVRVPEDLHAYVTEQAREEQVSISQWVRGLLCY